jgi:SAM-dependent methyltransferase
MVECSIDEHRAGGRVKQIPARYTRHVAEHWTVRDLGEERVLTVDGAEHRTRYSARVLELLVARKGPRRAALYLPFKATRGRHFLARLLAYLEAQGARDLAVLEVGCSFGHNTEYLDEQPVVGAIHTFDVDPTFVEIVRLKVAEQRLHKVRSVLGLSDAATRRLPWPDGAFDLVLAVGVIEHLPARDRHRYVDEYYRVLAPGGHLAVLDTPNRAFPLETHSVGLPGVQWLPPALAWRYARLCKPRLRRTPLEEFAGGAWRNASWAECLPSSGRAGLVDVTEEAGYGWRFFRETARSRLRRAALPAFALLVGALRALGRPPSLVLPYFNLVFRKEAPATRR